MSRALKVGMGAVGIAAAVIGARYATGEVGELWDKSFQECRFEALRTASSNADAQTTLTVDAAAGKLEVTGVAGLGRVEVEARACASREEWLDDLQISLESSGADLLLDTHYPDRDGWRGGNGRSSLDLEVRLPAGMALNIDDASGSITVTGTGDLWIDDSSGSITAEKILGSVRIDDASGSLKIGSVEGDVMLEDGSGSISITDVGGDVEVDDGSGSIRISGVGGSVVISEDGGGSIRVQDVEGNFTVEGDGGRGSITHSGIRGEVSVPTRKGRGG